MKALEAVKVRAGAKQPVKAAVAGKQRAAGRAQPSWHGLLCAVRALRRFIPIAPPPHGVP